MTPPHIFRAIAAEAIATLITIYMDPAMRLEGLSPDDIRKRAALKVQMDPELKLLLTGCIDTLEIARDHYSDYRIGQLLQDGVHTMNSAGRELTVDVAEDRVKVKNILTGAGLDVADGAFVIFIDGRAASGAALKAWQKMASDDTHLMIIPVDVPEGQTVEGMVAAKRQEEGGFAR